MAKLMPERRVAVCGLRFAVCCLLFAESDQRTERVDKQICPKNRMLVGKLFHAPDPTGNPHSRAE